MSECLSNESLSLYMYVSWASQTHGFLRRRTSTTHVTLASLSACPPAVSCMREARDACGPLSPSVGHATSPMGTGFSQPNMGELAWTTRRTARTSRGTPWAICTTAGAIHGTGTARAICSRTRCVGGAICRGGQYRPPSARRATHGSDGGGVGGYRVRRPS